MSDYNTCGGLYKRSSGTNLSEQYQRKCAYAQGRKHIKQLQIKERRQKHVVLNL